MFFLLPKELQTRIYGYDPTFHEKYKSVMKELIVNRELHHIFHENLDQVLFSPSYRFHVLQQYLKIDFERYCGSTGIFVKRRLTKRRLLAILSAFHLTTGIGTDDWFYEHGNSMWLFI